MAEPRENEKNSETERRPSSLHRVIPDPEDMSEDARFRRRLALLTREVMIAHGTDPAALPDLSAVQGVHADHGDQRGEPDGPERVPARRSGSGPGPGYFDIRPTAAFLLDLGGRVVRRAVGKLETPAGGSTLDTMLLAVARFPGGATTRELARMAEVPLSTAATALTRLDADGLVERRRDPADKRRRRVRATAEGRRRAEQVAAAWRQTNDRLLDGLTASERDELGRLLRRAVSALVPRGAGR